MAFDYPCKSGIQCRICKDKGSYFASVSIREQVKVFSVVTGVAPLP